MDISIRDWSKAIESEFENNLKLMRSNELELSKLDTLIQHNKQRSEELIKDTPK